MTAMERRQASVDALVELLEDVQGALRIFIKMANGLKWVAGVVLACSGMTWAYKHFGDGI